MNYIINAILLYRIETSFSKINKKQQIKIWKRSKKHLSVPILNANAFMFKFIGTCLSTSKFCAAGGNAEKNANLKHA